MASRAPAWSLHQAIEREWVTSLSSGRHDIRTLEWLLLAATTRTFRPTGERLGRLAAVLCQLEQAGWRFRQTSPRYYVCWRTSRLIAESEAPIAVFPDGRVGLSRSQRVGLVTLELLRRIARLGAPVAWARLPAAERARMQQAILCAAAVTGLGSAEPALATAFFRDVERAVWRAALGGAVAADGHGLSWV